MFASRVATNAIRSLKNAKNSLINSSNALKVYSLNQNSFKTYSLASSARLNFINNKQNVFQRNLSTSTATKSEEQQQQPTSSSTKNEKYEFIAETKQLLNIVAKSLYSDKEVFIRELISNSSDAIEKLKYVQLSEQKEQSSANKADLPYEIRINTNDLTNILTIHDTGLGMTKDELIQNLGTIAHSGSKAFIEKLANSDSKDAKNIIGQFGVGFYSAFMVADSVKVISKSYKPNEKAFEWNSNGDGTYEVGELAEGDKESIDRGTKIVLHLKPDCNEFAKDERLKEIIKKYSNFVRYPIYVNNERINSIQALWLEDAKNITEEQHEEFYKFISNNPYDKPRYVLQYKTDAPMHIRSLFYIPAYRPSIFDISQESDIKVSLYSKQVLILQNANQLLPRYLRFVKGVVDSEDIPLNLSREMLQDSNLIKRLKTILANRIIKFFNEQSKLDNKKFTEFYEDYKMYFKEAIARSTDDKEKEEIASLLRFESNKTEPNTTITLDEYIKRMKPDQKSIYYFAAPTRDIAVSSAYFEAIKQKDYEVLFLFDPNDEIVVLQLNRYLNKDLVSIESEIEKEKNKDDVILEGDSRSLNNDQANELKNWLANKFSKKVKHVKITTKLESHPCVVTTKDMGAVRHFIKTNILQREKVKDIFTMIELNMEINPKNSIIKALYKLHKSDVQLAELLAEQLLDNALLNAGLVDDARFVLKNLNTLLEQVFEKTVQQKLETK